MMRIMYGELQSIASCKAANKFSRDIVFDSYETMVNSYRLLADDEAEATGPSGRSYAQHKGHEDVRAFRIQLLRRQFVQVPT